VCNQDSDQHGDLNDGPGGSSSLGHFSFAQDDRAGIDLAVRVPIPGAEKRHAQASDGDDLARAWSRL
jgi:hypothetical protein